MNHLPAFPLRGVSRRGISVAAFAIGTALVAAATLSASGRTPPANVDAARIAAADAEPQNWMSHGRTYDEQRFSPLDTINAGNVAGLGLAWFQDMNTGRGQEATPIVVDGVIYVSSAWSIVHAFDARTGKPLWTFDPEVKRSRLVDACCDAVNRGVAAWQGKIFIGTLDGRLIAVDAATGRKLWSTLTVDLDQPYTITGAPRVIKGKVIIGNGGAEMGVRGYVSAFDVETGKQLWRFYTVPGDPSKPAENAAMAMARKTWTGDLWWKRGGGGTAWDSFAYDPKLDLLYIGTGNGSPWSQKERSPEGGDNLFLSSIVAVRPDTGEYVWHYQETPNDNWDYTSTQQMVLADLPIDGAKRRVIMHAPKNGFFYVLDAASGKLLSAKPFVPVNWATGIDLKTGRPNINPDARYDLTGKPFVVMPGSRGGHNWLPMSFSPKTGLVYIPAHATAQRFGIEPGFAMRKNAYNTGADIFDVSGKADEMKVPPTKSFLLAWDPVQQREVWRVPQLSFAAGGTLATAGNIVFQGDGGSHFAAYSAENGKPLWKADVQAVAMAGPVTYRIGKEQYVAVMTGCAGDYASACNLVDAAGRKPIMDRLMVFKLGGKAALPARPAPVPLMLDPPISNATPEQVAEGEGLYKQYCSICHGRRAVSRGVNPDLRQSGFIQQQELFDQVLLQGILADGGMASFEHVLDRKQTAAIRAYIVDRATSDKAAQAK